MVIVFVPWMVLEPYLLKDSLLASYETIMEITNKDKN
jgi:hypothetical protein